MARPLTDSPEIKGFSSEPCARTYRARSSALGPNAINASRSRSDVEFRKFARAASRLESPEGSKLQDYGRADKT